MFERYWTLLTAFRFIADRQAYLADVLAKLVNGWPAQKLDKLLPRAWAKQQAAYTLAA